MSRGRTPRPPSARADAFIPLADDEDEPGDAPLGLPARPPRERTPRRPPLPSLRGASPRITYAQVMQTFQIRFGKLTETSQAEMWAMDPSMVVARLQGLHSALDDRRWEDARRLVDPTGQHLVFDTPEEEEAHWENVALIARIGHLAGSARLWVERLTSAERWRYPMNDPGQFLPQDPSDGRLLRAAAFTHELARLRREIVGVAEGRWQVPAGPRTAHAAEDCPHANLFWDHDKDRLIARERCRDCVVYQGRTLTACQVPAMRDEMRTREKHTELACENIRLIVAGFAPYDHWEDMVEDLDMAEVFPVHRGLGVRADAVGDVLFADDEQ